MGERGAGIGFIAGAVGLFFTLLVLSRGGGYFAIVHDLQWFVPLMIVGGATALAAGRLGSGKANTVLWLLVVVLGGIAWNFLVYAYKLGRGAFGVLLPLVRPTGIDLRVGIYAAGKSFSNAESGYPPFTLWLGKAFTAVSLSTGYVIQVCLLVGFAAGSAVLCALWPVPGCRRPRNQVRGERARRANLKGGPRGRSTPGRSACWAACGCSRPTDSCSRSNAGNSTSTPWSSF